MATDEAARTRRLAPSTVDLWIFELLATHEAVRDLERTLTPDELERADRFRFPDDRMRFSVARAAARSILSGYVGIPPQGIRFRYSPTGKPSLQRSQNPHHIHFNLSHSGDVGLLAVSRGRHIGVDVERHRPLSDLSGMARRFFSDFEVATLDSLDEPAREEAFFACWTRKEAYLKATGRGLSERLDRFSVSLAPNEPARILHVEDAPDEADRWCLVDINPGSGYSAALAVEGNECDLVRHHWIPEEASGSA